MTGYCCLQLLNVAKSSYCTSTNVKSVVKPVHVLLFAVIGASLMVGCARFATQNTMFTNTIFRDLNGIIYIFVKYNR